MSHSEFVFTAEALTDSMLEQFVNERGGVWDGELQQGTLETADAYIIVSLDDRAVGGLEEEELDVVTGMVGSVPRSAVCILIGYKPESLELGRRVASAILDRWPGVFDQNTVNGPGGPRWLKSPFL